MLSWLFKKRGAATTPATLPAHAPAPPAPGLRQANAAATAKARLVEDAAADWPTQLRAAVGNDVALLRLTQSAAPLTIKLAAVEALGTEQGLKQAEREFRTHDRKVHRIAKQRLEAAVAQREARARADSLVERAEALLSDADLPINHVVSLDKDWAALPAPALQSSQRERFAALRARLDAAIQTIGQKAQQLQRWTAEAKRGLPDWRRGMTAAAEHGNRADLAALIQTMAALRNTRPDVPATTELDLALMRALHTCALLEPRLAWLEALTDGSAEPATGPVTQARPEHRADAPKSAPQVEPVHAAQPEWPPQSLPDPNAETDEVEQPATATVAVAVAVADEVAVAVEVEVEVAVKVAVKVAVGVGEGDPEADPEAGRLQQSEPALVARSSSEAATVPESDNGAESAPHSAQPEALPHTAAKDWKDLPSLDDAELAQLVEQRHALWLSAHRPAMAESKTSPPLVQRSRRPARPEAPTDAQRLHIETLLQQAEATLAEGRLGDLQQQVSALDATTSRINAAALPDALRIRHQALWAEQGRLRDWQQWGGGRVRDDLTDEAEALARSTVAWQTLATATDPGTIPAPKLNLKLHAEAVQALHQRWKDLDRLGAAASQELWQRFDAALQLAYQPLAAQQAALKASRQDNLLAREALLATLEALALPAMPTPASDQRPAAEIDPAESAAGHQAGTHADGASLDWRDLLRELDRFQLAWRKLGPVEHTVPTRARQALALRMQAAVTRIETPLQDARRAAASAREALIARAEALLQEPGRTAGQPMSDAGRQVRELQASWQENARGLPLPRGLENALWARFKAATDAVFAQRHAVFAARDDELQTNLTVRESLLNRLEALGADTPEIEIKETLADVDRAWRQAGEVPRAAGERLEQRLRSAHAAAVQWLGSRAARLWQAQLDTLSTRLALCEAMDDGASQDDLAVRWSAISPLPALWEQALAQRWASQALPGPLASSEVDELLLQLETTLDLPTAPEWQAARRALKLRALKDSMEGRSDVAQGPARQAAWLQAILRQGGLAPEQRARLQAILLALRQAPPGSLVTKL